jgi:hypothetical protein
MRPPVRLSFVLGGVGDLDEVGAVIHRPGLLSDNEAVADLVTAMRLEGTLRVEAGAQGAQHLLLRVPTP